MAPVNFQLLKLPARHLYVLKALNKHGKCFNVSEPLCAGHLLSETLPSWIPNNLRPQLLLFLCTSFYRSSSVYFEKQKTKSKINKWEPSAELPTRKCPPEGGARIRRSKWHVAVSTGSEITGWASGTSQENLFFSHCGFFHWMIGVIPVNKFI